jgi:hypothetical protein
MNRISQGLAAERQQREQLRQASVRQRAEIDRMATSAAQYFGMFVGPAAIATAALDTMVRFNREIAAAGTKLEADRAGLGQLSQLAVVEKTPKNVMEALVAEAKDVYATGATGTLGEAGTFVNKLYQAGFEKEQRGIAARALATGVLPEAVTTATSVAALRTAFPELTPNQVMGMGMFAGIASPGGVDQLIQDTAKSAQQLRALGYRPEFGIAATSMLTQAYPGQGEAATRLDAYGRQLERFGMKFDPKLRGMRPIEALGYIGEKTKGFTDREMLENYFGGRQEAVGAGRTMYQKRLQIAELMAGTATADGGFLETAVDLAEGTPEINAARQAVASRNQRELSRMGPATTQQLLDAIRDEAVAGRGAVATRAIDFATWLSSFASEDQKIASLRETARSQRGMYSPELLESIDRHLESVDSKTKSVPLRGGRQE